MCSVLCPTFFIPQVGRHKKWISEAMKGKILCQILLVTPLSSSRAVVTDSKKSPALPSSVKRWLHNAVVSKM